MQSKGTSNTEGFDVKVENSPSVKVPPKKRLSLAIVVSFVMASFFLLLFGYGIAQVYGIILSYVLLAFSLLGLDPLVTTLIMALIFLFLGSVFLLIAKRGSTAISKIEAGVKIMFDDTPLDYYDLSEVPTESLAREFVGNNTAKNSGRGCKLELKGIDKGFTIDCDEMPVTKSMRQLSNGEVDSLDWKQKGIVVAVFAFLGIIFFIITYIHLLTGAYLYIVWGVFMFSLFFAMVEIKALKFWGICVAWGVMNVTFIFMAIDPYFFWTMLGAWICFTLTVAVLYLLTKHACITKRSWFCDLM